MKIYVTPNGTECHLKPLDFERIRRLNERDKRNKMNKELNEKIAMIKVTFYDDFTACLNGEIGLNELMLLYNQRFQQINQLVYDVFISDTESEVIECEVSEEK